MRVLSLFVGLGLVLSACSGRSEVAADLATPVSSPTASPVAKAELKIDAELEKEFAKIAADAKGKVGVAAILIETGDAAFLNANDRFPMQSVYKLPIAMAVMERVKAGEFSLDKKIAVTREDFVRPGMASALRDENPNGGEFTIRELIRLSLVESDGTASDVQLRILGGPEKVQSYLTQIGITDMKVVNTEKEIGRDWGTQFENWATPIASVELLRWLLDAQRAEDPEGRDPKSWSRNPPTGYNLIFCDMVDSVTGPKRLKGLIPPIEFKAGLMAAHKTGTSGTRDGVTAATNDIGLLRFSVYDPTVKQTADPKTIAIAVFVSDSRADEKTRESIIAKVAKAVWDRWSKK